MSAALPPRNLNRTASLPPPRAQQLAYRQGHSTHAFFLVLSPLASRLPSIAHAPALSQTVRARPSAPHLCAMRCCVLRRSESICVRRSLAAL